MAKSDLGKLPMVGIMFQKHHILLERNLEKDRETIVQKCKELNQCPEPTILFLFPEGTIFNPETKTKYNSPYKHLLPPKTGGIQLVQEHYQYDLFVDATLIYEDDPYNTKTYIYNSDFKRFQTCSHVRFLLKEKEIFTNIHDVWKEKEECLETWCKKMIF
jgi:hypothetical protein